MCCDILSEGALNAELIDAQVEQLIDVAGKFNVDYDGWGTYFEDPDAQDEDDEDGEDGEAIDGEDNGIRH
jgi:regulator of RNase E activity RraB